MSHCGKITAWRNVAPPNGILLPKMKQSLCCRKFFTIARRVRMKYCVDVTTTALIVHCHILWLYIACWGLSANAIGLDSRQQLIHYVALQAFHTAAQWHVDGSCFAVFLQHFWRTDDFLRFLRQLCPARRHTSDIGDDYKRHAGEWWSIGLDFGDRWNTADLIFSHLMYRI